MTFFPLFPPPPGAEITVLTNMCVCVCIANNLTSTVAIPSDIAPGNYIIRHEIIALHSAGQENGAQSYPQCKFSFFPSSLEISYTSSSSSKKEKTTNSQLTQPSFFFKKNQVSTSSSPAPAQPLPKAPSAPPCTLPPTPELSPTFTLRPSPTKCPVRLCTQEQEQTLLRQTPAALRSVAMLVDFALEADYLRWMLLGRREGSRRWENFCGREGLEGTRIGWHRLDR